MNLRVLNLLEKALDQKAVMAKDDNAVFWCPVCKKDYHKKKLVVCLDENSPKFGWWRCWVCKDSNNMSGKNIFNLFKKLNINRSYFYELTRILKSIHKNFNNLFNKRNKDKSIINLPDEFISLINNKDNIFYDYLMKRKLTDRDIIKYNIGYCKTGKYQNRIIIPSYDYLGDLNYFIARSIVDDHPQKYKNPPFEHKEFSIIFELHINWDLPILIVEGVFDAIAAKRNVVPLLGQSINIGLMNKLIEKDVKEIIIALDPDVLKTSIKHIERFTSEGIGVKFVNLKNDDPSKLGFEKFINLYNKSTDMDFENLIMLKMES